MAKIISTVEARMGSSRLPGKTLAPICGEPMLKLLIERLKRIPMIDEVVIATTTEPEDKKIEALAVESGVKCYRGSSDDVLSRVLQAALSQKADLIVEMTGDNPLLDPGVVEDVIKLFLSGDYDYVCNFLDRTFPRGLDTQIFPTRLLAEVDRITQNPLDREHVSLYIYEHPERYRLGNLSAPPKLHRPELRLTVDTGEDLSLVREIYGRLYRKKPDFSIQDVIALLDANPELLKINQHILQKPVS